MNKKQPAWKYLIYHALSRLYTNDNLFLKYLWASGVKTTDILVTKSVVYVKLEEYPLPVPL